ncbi:UBC23 [Symbiodinium sp. KB8]|nr:UBC23 [Symbiodinium sp. KB8]
MLCFAAVDAAEWLEDCSQLKKRARGPPICGEVTSVSCEMVGVHWADAWAPKDPKIAMPAEWVHPSSIRRLSMNNSPSEGWLLGEHCQASENPSSPCAVLTRTTTHTTVKWASGLEEDIVSVDLMPRQAFYSHDFLPHDFVARTADVDRLVPPRVETLQTPSPNFTFQDGSVQYGSTQTQSETNEDCRNRELFSTFLGEVNNEEIIPAPPPMARQVPMGVVQSVDLKARTALVEWRCSLQENPQEVSLFELAPHPLVDVRLADIVFIPPQHLSQDKGNWVGRVTAFSGFSAQVQLVCGRSEWFDVESLSIADMDGHYESSVSSDEEPEVIWVKEGPDMTDEPCRACGSRDASPSREAEREEVCEHCEQSQSETSEGSSSSTRAPEILAFDVLQEDLSPLDHKFVDRPSPAPKVLMRAVRREHSVLQKGLLDGGEGVVAPIMVRTYSSRCDLFRAMVVGPPGTPYSDVPFFFDLSLSPQYPSEPPLVHFMANYVSSCEKLNPNLYNDGKVCLSILGTWAGPGWDPQKSTLLQVLISLQGLVLVEDPYFNEPGHEWECNSEHGRNASALYNENVRLLVLRTALNVSKQPPSGFEEIVASHFARHGPRLLAECEEALLEVNAGRSSEGFRKVLARNLVPGLREQWSTAEQLTAYVGTHQELFTRFQTAVEQLDTEKDMRKKVVSERDDLIKTRDEIARARDEIARALELERDKAEQERMHAEQARKELAEAEPPGPAQLTVNDVLISVCFEEVKGAPLEVKPWDTNFEEVVSSWLQAAQRSQNLQSSLVRLPFGESEGLPARWQDHSPTHQPKWHKHVKSKAPQENVLTVSGLQEVCGLAFRQEDRTSTRSHNCNLSLRGAERQTCPVMDIEVWWEVVLRLFPEGECDQDFDGLLLWEDFQEFVLRGLQPLLKGQKTGQSAAVKAMLPMAFAQKASNLQAYQPVQKAVEEVTKLPAETPSSATPTVLKDPSGKSRAVGFANVAMVPSARDMTDLLKEYTFPENDSALGRGAFGTVMKVTHNGTGEVRAMKAVRLSDGADSAQLRELVELEVSMLKSLDHVNLLRLHEAFRCMYLITELCAGGSLAERLEQQRTLRKPMLEGMAAAYAEQILSAASYCHDRGVLHRDLKPENVLFLTPRSDSPVKVIDFGLSDTMERIRQNCTQEIHDRSGALGAVARLLPKLPGGLEILATKETKEVMQRAGTPHYMAPEVYTGMYGDRADVWSIGVILFEMLSNRHPFYTSGNDLEAVKRRILSPDGADFCDPSWGEVTAAAQRACRECLMLDPDRRPSAQRMLAHKWFDTVPRLALGMSGGMDSGRSGFLALARSPPRIAASQVCSVLLDLADAH